MFSNIVMELSNKQKNVSNKVWKKRESQQSRGMEVIYAYQSQKMLSYEYEQEGKY